MVGHELAAPRARSRGVHVVGVHVGYVDTPWPPTTSGPKRTPADLVATVFDAVQAGAYEVLADETSVQLKAGLSAPMEAVYPQLKSVDA